MAYILGIPLPGRDYLSSIPEEARVGILSNLTHQDLAAARLSCRILGASGRGLLGRNLIFAHRLDTIARFREIIASPWRNNVTTLTYDSSRYWENHVRDEDAYANNYMDVERYSIDPWRISVQQDSADLANLNCALPAVPDVTNELLNAEGRRLVSNANRATWSNDTHAKYIQRFKVQSTLETNNTALQLITEAFRRCPRLKHVVMTDYRGLARQGESYAEACLRMFGTTLPPETYVCTDIDDIVVVMFALTAVPSAGIQSFSIGPHPFASVQGMMSGYYMHRLTTEVQSTLTRYPADSFINVFDRHFKPLRRLRLPYYDPNDWGYVGRTPENIWYMLNAARGSVRHLSITRACVAGIHPGADGVRYPANSDFLSLTFPDLTSVEFHHLHLTDDADLRAFLLRHRQKLRQVTLIACHWAVGTAGIDQSIALAEWGRKNLTLTGIEYVHAMDLDRLAHVDWEEGDEDRWQLRDHPPAEIAIRHVERLEKCWLSSTGNSLPRTVDVADRVERAKDVTTPNWWMRPGRLQLL